MKGYTTPRVLPLCGFMLVWQEYPDFLGGPCGTFGTPSCTAETGCRRVLLGSCQNDEYSVGYFFWFFLYLSPIPPCFLAFSAEAATRAEIMRLSVEESRRQLFYSLSNLIVYWITHSTMTTISFEAMVRGCLKELLNPANPILSYIHAIKYLRFTITLNKSSWQVLWKSRRLGCGGLAILNLFCYFHKCTVLGTRINLKERITLLVTASRYPVVALTFFFWAAIFKYLSIDR